MCSCKWIRRLAALIVLACGRAYAAGVVLGLGVEADDAGGRALSAIGDFGVTDDTWLSAAVAKTRSGGVVDLDTIYLDGAIEHSFDRFGVRVAAGYWGDKDILDSADLGGSLLLRGDRGALSIDYIRRSFDFSFQDRARPARSVTTEFHSNGLGATGTLNTSPRSRLFAGGMAYRYSRDLLLQERSDRLRGLSSSRLSLMNSLLDHRAYLGLEWRFDLTSIDFRFEHWQTAIDQGTVNSIGVGLLTPIGDRKDVEFRVHYDQSRTFGRTVSLSAFLYYFGGGE